MPHVIEYNASKSKEAAEKYANALKLLGIENIKDTSISCQALKNIILELNKEIGINNKITEYNIDKNEFEKAIEEMSLNALKDVCLATNPIQPSLEDVKGIYRKIL